MQKLLTLFSAAIAELDLFEPGPLEEALKLVVTNAGVKAGDLVHAVRIAVTGKPVGPGLYDCLTIIGRDQALARIERVLPLCG